MTEAQQHAARMLIPGAYEPATPLHRATPPASMVQTNPLGVLRPDAASAATPYVVHAPARPTTGLGQAAAILGDLALVAAILFVAVATPALVIWGIHTVATLTLDNWGWR
jgi:hypothetical protein